MVDDGDDDGRCLYSLQLIWMFMVFLTFWVDAVGLVVMNGDLQIPDGSEWEFTGISWDRYGEIMTTMLGIILNDYIYLRYPLEYFLHSF